MHMSKKHPFIAFKDSVLFSPFVRLLYSLMMIISEIVHSIQLNRRDLAFHRCHLQGGELCWACMQGRGHHIVSVG